MILTVGESKPKRFKIGAAVIRAVEQLDHTHSFLSWRDTALDIRKVCQAHGGGGQLLINTQFRQEHHIVRIFQYEVTPAQVQKLELWAWSHLRPYGYLHILGLGLMRGENALLRLLGSKGRARNQFKDGDYSLVCVEMTAKAIEIATGIALPGDIEDYGLRELHEFNCNSLKSGLCTKASEELINLINAKATL